MHAFYAPSYHYFNFLSCFFSHQLHAKVARVILNLNLQQLPRLVPKLQTQQTIDCQSTAEPRPLHQEGGGARGSDQYYRVLIKPCAERQCIVLPLYCVVVREKISWSGKYTCIICVQS